MSATTQQPEIGIPLFPASPAHGDAARSLAARFALPLASRRPPARPALRVGDDGVSLLDGGNRFKPVRVDFLHGEAGYGQRHGGGVGRALARAVGLRRGRRPDVLDATAGLGRDGFVLAGLGCRVHLVERSGAVACLLADGLARAARDPGPASAAVARISLAHTDAVDLMGPRREAAADVVYLDPMYPARRKSALPGRAMQLLREIVGPEQDGAALLAAGLTHARQRVVVKRPRRAAVLDGRPPDFSIETRHTRYDVYMVAASGAVAGGPGD
ncbi:MAG TPA: class I SAM-dependent methyltransferase [Gammaproteobacteria bacterium]|nr:class I SAM-dependent methyltransferase [Gammaproteobacteria bacterium]